MALLRDQGSERSITLPARCLIGRDTACDLVLTDRTVSGQHAVIQWTGDLWEIRDLGSRNGTFLNEARLDAGVGTRLLPGAHLRFGGGSAVWQVLDIAGPQLMALNLRTGEVRLAEGGHLALPDPLNAEIFVYQDNLCEWIVELGGEPGPLADRDVLVTADGDRWRVHLGIPAVGTLNHNDVVPHVAALKLRFTITPDEEHVELVGHFGKRQLDLQARAHHYPLLLLARQRLADQAAGVPEPLQGWMHQPELLRQLRIEDSQLNLNIYRARAQLGRLGVADAAALVERRVGTRQLRIGVAQLEIVRLSA